MDLIHLRAWRSHRQGLDGGLSGLSSATTLERTGWVRSVGGANPYLSLHARNGASRQSVDASVADGAICELPCARGCTYLVPEADYAIALKVGQSPGDSAEVSLAIRHLGVTRREIEELSEAIMQCLASATKDPKDLRSELGSVVRNLGEEGKKRGQTSTLPLALGEMQSQGLIRRVPANGRLDQQRYGYRAWTPSPLLTYEGSGDEALTSLARMYFRWIGLARISEFQWMAGLGVKAAKDAVGPLDLVPFGDDGFYGFAEDIDSLETFQVPSGTCYRLVGSIDGLLHYRQDLEGLLDPEDAGHPLLVSGKKPGSRLTELTDHGILDRGRLVGVWQFDPEAGEIVWVTFRPESEALGEVIQRTSDWIRDDLGDARSFSLDSPESRKPRLEVLRSFASSSRT